MTKLTNILSADAFKHILSIGYEFEAHNLSKVILSKNKKKYFSSKSNGRGTDDEVEMIMEDKRSTVLTKEEYDEIVCKQENSDNVKFCIYSDNNKDTHAHINSFCKPSVPTQTVPFENKNNWWSIGPSSKSSKYIMFNDQVCDYFPDVEWNITFYNVATRKFKVIDTFLEATQMILSQLSDMDKQKVKLYAGPKGSSKKSWSTLLFGNTFLAIDKNPLNVVPQLTFTCHVRHCLEIIQAFKLLKPKMKELIRFAESAPFDAAQQGYLFLVMYMAKMFEEYSEQNGLRYYKYFTAFLPRHTLVSLIRQINPDVLEYAKQENGDQYITQFLESSEEQTELDKGNKYSTLFPLENDIVFIEFRHLPHFLRLHMGHQKLSLELISLLHALQPKKTKTNSNRAKSSKRAKTSKRSP